MEDSYSLNLNGKVAIVTGASSGIGEATALALAEAGAQTVLAARRIDRLQKLASKIAERGGKALAIRTDVTQKENLERMVQETLASFGQIDILVNNAGILDMKDFLALTDQDWQKILDVNLRGYFWAAQLVSKEMEKRRSGKIINIASIAGLAAFPQITVYNISKAAVIMLTKSLATELGPFGIMVNAIAPGVIETEMTKGLLADEKTRNSFLSKIPLGRVGRAEEIASAVLFLASDLASYFNGSVLVVDGGWTAHL